MTGGRKTKGGRESPLVHRKLSVGEVSEWFADAVARTRFKPPPVASIEQVAHWLSQYRLPDYDVLRPSKAVEYGKRFLKHLELEYEERLIAPFRGTPLESHMVELVNNAAQPMFDFVEYFGLRIGKETWHDHARWVDVYSVRAWKDGGPKWPRALKDGSPRVLFVAFVLGAWGIEKDGAQIADALRGKYGNKIMMGFELGGFPDRKTADD